MKEPGVEGTKRPDVLVFREDHLRDLNEATQELLGEYVAADRRADLLPTLEREGVPEAAEMAIEAESSTFHVGRREYGSPLSAYAKDEDFRRLRSWRERHGVPILVCQLFFDRVYVVPFAAYEKYAEDARRGSASVPGLEHGEIPVIRKPALQAKVETFPPTERLGEFVEAPSVVERTGSGIEACEFG